MGASNRERIDRGLVAGGADELAHQADAFARVGFTEWSGEAGTGEAVAAHRVVVSAQANRDRDG
jgi:hypothetical protein